MFIPLRPAPGTRFKLLWRAAAVGLAALTVAIAHAASPQISVGDFVRRSQFSAPLLSPDGKHLVVKQRIQLDGRDVMLIVVYRLEDMKTISTVRLPVFEEPAGYVWITNSRLAVTVAREFGSLEKPQLTGEILAMDVDGQRQQYLYGYKSGQRGTYVKLPDRGWASVNHVPEELNGHLFLTEHEFGDRQRNTLLHDVDSVTAKRHLITDIDKPDFDFLVQDDGTPRFAFGSDEESYLSVFRYEGGTRPWKELPEADQANLFPLALSPGNRDVVASVAVQGGPRALVRQSLADGVRTVLAEDKVGDIDLIEWGPRNQPPFAAATRIGRPTPRYFDEQPEAQLHRQLSSQFPGAYVHFINYSRDGSKLLFSVESDRDPGSFYLLDRSANKATLLFAEMPWIDPARMAERRPIQFQARDGVELHGFLTLPPQPGEGKPPLILLPHGGPHQISDDWFFETDAQFLASRGYAVLQINYRGSGGRGIAFQKRGYRQWGGRTQDDLIDGVRWVIGQGAVDSSRICAYGASFGAYSAMMTAVREPGLFKCAVGYSGLYDLALMYRNDHAVESKAHFNYLVRAIGQDPVDLANNSPTRLAEKLTVPVLLVHGSEDERTPPNQAEAMRNALKKAGRPPEWLYVEGEGHGFYSEKNRQAFYERLEAFLAKHLGK
jgi:dipeptidyl aminopeptidase/acylaminoacyl peptidase